MLKKLQALKAKKGFTLVELIVVIAIIGVLAAILIPTLSGVIESSRKRGVESTCSSLHNLCVTYCSQFEAKTGFSYNSDEANSANKTAVDMDTGEGDLTLEQYVGGQIVELVNKKDKSTCGWTIAAGKVTECWYKEGNYTACWNTSDGQGSAYKGDGDSNKDVIPADKTEADIQAPPAKS